MALNPVELAMQQTLTEAFILADATEIVLVRGDAKVADGAGGWVQGDGTGTPLSPQTVRLIPQSDKVEELVTSDGTRAKPKFVLLGTTDLDVQRYDVFLHNGNWYEVAQIHDGPAYEVKGDVIPSGRR